MGVNRIRGKGKRRRMGGEPERGMKGIFRSLKF